MLQMYLGNISISIFRYKPWLLSEVSSYHNNSRLWSDYYPGAAINWSVILLQYFLLMGTHVNHLNVELDGHIYLKALRFNI